MGWLSLMDLNLQGELECEWDAFVSCLIMAGISLNDS